MTAEEGQLKIKVALRFSLFIKKEVATALGQYLDQMLHKKVYFLSTVIICEKKCISSGMGKSLIVKVL